MNKAWGILLLVAAMPAAQAADADKPNSYAAGLFNYNYPDASRDASYGLGASVLYGMPLVNDLDLEFNLSTYANKRESSNKHDYGYAGSFDLHYLLADSRQFGLFFVGGVGGLYERQNNDNDLSPFADAGLAINFWNLLGNPALSLRTEARYYGVDHKASTHRDHAAFAGASWLNDARFNAGLQWDFGAGKLRRGAAERDSDGDGVVDSKDECPNTPHGVLVDRRGCPIEQDSDGDGVVDSKDACPNTPPGVVVDATGCPPAAPAPLPPPAPLLDSDGDGVPDTIDDCPNTPAGMVVDVHGCPRDEDNDGVLNENDLCPHTPPGLKVDAQGCVIEQTAVFHNINFEFGSEKLTAEAKTVLDGIAT
ncbi:MAG TPA: thrombospondin type 3 repeat-containing protein, partial [Nevskiaceae bacterium]|nr:thrombospondin type 3 repeat-containing protein [Nevskiaceae bacterium]